jgi:ssRNA-specific RNase YbeY (16S rRNA maturation enzyme)
MTNKEKATHILAIIMEELNMPKGATIGDVAIALSSIDENNEIMGMLKPILRNAVIDEIKATI